MILASLWVTAAILLVALVVALTLGIITLVAIAWLVGLLAGEPADEFEP